jgi:hypothetical protein
MPPSTPHIVESLSWDGLISGTTALGLGVALAVVAAWLSWRERRAVGGAWAIAFWCMRVIAIGCALWMLAGPTRMKTERTTTMQSVAIFADGSGSMDVVDQPEADDGVRWALAMEATKNDSPLVGCDRLVVALGAAQADCRRFSRHVKDHRAPRQLAATFATVESAIERVKMHIDSMQSALRGVDATMYERFGRIAALIDGPIATSQGAIRGALKSPKPITAADFAVNVEQLTEGIGSARRRTLVLAADLIELQPKSKSQGQAGSDALSRRDKAARALDALESRLAKEKDESLRIERFRFDRTPVPVSLDVGWTRALLENPPIDANATAESTDLASQSPGSAGEVVTNVSAVLQRLSEQRAGNSIRLAMLFTDGCHNDIEARPPQEVASQLGNVPVFVVPVGASLRHRDLVLHRVEAPAVVAEKDSAVIDVIVTSFDCAGHKSAVVLKHHGSQVDRKPIEFREENGDHRVRFSVPAKELGWQEYIVEVEPIDEEANTANNFQPVSFEVVRAQIRVLLADGVPRWEYRYLNQLFRREAHVKFEELLFFPNVHGTGSLAERPEFPGSVDAWARYDVVILGDVSPRQLSPASQRALDEFVRKRGGNLIIVAGQDSMPGGFKGQPLMDLLPVEVADDVTPQEGHAIRLTEDGRFNAALLIADSFDESRQAWDEAYQRFPIFGLSEYCRPKSTARVLIEAVPQSSGGAARVTDGKIERALLCWERIGAGRVAYLAAPETYRLRFRQGDRLHHRFWGQFLRWVTASSTGAGSDLVRLQTDHTRYATGEPVQVTVWLKDPSGRPLANEPIQVEARAFDGAAISVGLTPDAEVAGRYFGTLDHLAAGAYQISVSGRVISELLPSAVDVKKATATITVRGADSIEMMNTQCNRALLEQLAELTGGQVIPPTAIDEVFKLVSVTPQVSETVERSPLWNRWSSLLIVFGCLLTEWIVRKSKGLV